MTLDQAIEYAINQEGLGLIWVCGILGSVNGSVLS
jgi:hypothetical protein